MLSVLLINLDFIDKAYLSTQIIFTRKHMNRTTYDMLTYHIRKRFMIFNHTRLKLEKNFKVINALSYPK